MPEFICIACGLPITGQNFSAYHHDNRGDCIKLLRAENERLRFDHSERFQSDMNVRKLVAMIDVLVAVLQGSPLYAGNEAKIIQTAEDLAREANAWNVNRFERKPSSTEGGG